MKFAAKDYVECDECGRFVHPDNINYLDNGNNICQNCLQESYDYCEECNEYHRWDEMNTAIDCNGDEIRICDYCAGNYEQCEECGCYADSEVAVETEDENGDTIFLCPDCAREEGAAI